MYDVKGFLFVDADAAVRDFDDDDDVRVKKLGTRLTAVARGLEDMAELLCRAAIAAGVWSATIVMATRRFRERDFMDSCE